MASTLTVILEAEFDLLKHAVLLQGKLELLDALFVYADTTSILSCS